MNPQNKKKIKINKMRKANMIVFPVNFAKENLQLKEQKSMKKSAE